MQEKKAELLLNPCGFPKQCHTRALILRPWRQRFCKAGTVPQPLPLRISRGGGSMTDSSAQSSCRELTLLQAEESWQHLLPQEGNCWLGCSRPGEMLKTCNASHQPAGIIRAQGFFPGIFHPELESGFTSFSGPRFLKNSQPPSVRLSSAESPHISPLLQSKQEPEGTKAADGGYRLAEHPSAGDPWLLNSLHPSLCSHRCLTGL